MNQPTAWVSSMLVVSKPFTEADGDSKIRICLDTRDLNVAIKREHFLMPTIEEIATRLHGAKKKCLVYLMPVTVSGRWN